MEIERVFLLRGMPSLPAHAEAIRIEQGYLSTGRPGSADSAAAPTEGRVRRMTHADGRVEYVHTIKRGLGRVREEIERPMTLQQFDQAWPATEDRRIRKTRHRVRDGSLTWEIDRFDDLDVVLAEVELPEPHTPVTIPAWLAPHVVREVTEEPEFRNFQLALKAARGKLRG